MKKKNRVERIALYLNIAVWAVLVLIVAFFSFQKILHEWRSGYFTTYYLQLSGVICLTGFSVIVLSVTTLWQMNDGNGAIAEK